jgi:hypothetical protein
METTLHRQLKSLYAEDSAACEVRMGSYRIDAVQPNRLVEIQHGSLSAISQKIRCLLKQNHNVLVVKPLAARKLLVKRRRRGGRVLSRRYSPSRASVFDLFQDLVHFVKVFPHPRLSLEVLMTEQEEHRLPPLARQRRRKGYRIQDRVLQSIHSRLPLQTAEDLRKMLPSGIEQPFSTANIAVAVDIPLWLAQKMAYCLRETGAIEQTGKRGNALLYRFSTAT